MGIEEASPAISPGVSPPDDVLELDGVAVILFPVKEAGGVREEPVNEGVMDEEIVDEEVVGEEVMGEEVVGEEVVDEEVAEEEVAEEAVEDPLSVLLVAGPIENKLLVAKFLLKSLSTKARKA